MMKRILLALVLCVLSAPAWAVCAVTNLTVKDAAGTPVTALVPYSDDGTGGNNCIPHVSTTNWGGGVLGAMANYGTSPGPVLVPGVNAFITNTPAVSQSGTWNIGTVTTLTSITNPVTANLGTIGGAATAANQSTEITALQAIQTNTGAAVPTGDNIIGRVVPSIPTGATVLNASTTGTTAATSATLSSGVGVTAFLCGFSIRANATAAATGNATVTGSGTTQNFTQWTAPNASGVGVIEEIYNPCLPASATNTNFVVTSAAPGTGGVVSVTAWGYSK